MSDERDDLLKEIGDALRVEPSPSFAAGVRTRIANESAPRRWTAWFMWAGAATAAAGAVAVFALPRATEPSTPAPVATAVAGATVTPVALGQVAPPTPFTAEAGAIAAPGARISVKPARIAAVVTNDISREVLVPTDQLVALNRLLAAVQRGRADVPASPVLTDPETGELLPLPPIVPLAGAGDGQGVSKGRDK